MGRWQVKFAVKPYHTRGGEQPIITVLGDLKKTQPVLGKLLEAGIRKLADRANHGPPLTEHVDRENGILEPRVGHKDIARAFFFFERGREIIVTNGYVKKGQKLDRLALKNAQECKKDWEERFP